MYSMAKRPSQRSRESGNAILEMAMTLIPMMVMFLGFINVSMVVFLQSTLTHATREGARWAVTYQSTYNGSNCASQAVCIASVVQTNAFGFLSGGQASLITVNYYTANNLSTPVDICNAGSCSAAQTLSPPQTLPNGTVVDYVNSPGNVVEVVVANYPWNWLLPISATGFRTKPSSISLGASSMDVLGGLQPGNTTPPAP